MNILTKGKRSLALRLECNHPTDQIKEPDICVVYIVSESTSRRYPNHDTSFKAIVDGASVSDSPFKNYKETQVGDKVVVPLLSIWKWEVVKKVASGTKIVFVLDGEKIQLPQERLGPIRQMVSYFEGKGA